MALSNCLAGRAYRHALPAALASCAALLAQAPPLPVGDGFAERPLWNEIASPRGLAGVAAGDVPGEFWYAVDHLLYHVDPLGARTVEHALAPHERLGLVARPRGRDELLFVDSTHGLLHVRNLTTGGRTVRQLPANTFDVAAAEGGATLVSANPSWPAPGSSTGIWCLDPTGGSAHREIVALTGPSGPLAVDPRTGDVFYATQHDTFPTPAGSTRLLRFPAARIATVIAGGAPLTASDGQVFASGLDGGYDLEFDDRGSLYVSDPHRGGVIRFLPDGRRDPTAVVPAGPEKVTAMAFVDHGPATFDPWQRADAGALLVVTADWISVGTIREIRPAPPELGATFGPIAPPGPVQLVATGLPRSGPVLFMLTGLPPLPAPTPLFPISGVTLWSDFDFRIPPLVGWAASDPSGRVQVDLTQPGGAWVTFHLAVAAASSTALGDVRVATSPTFSLTLLP